LHVWIDPFLSWLESIVKVSTVVPVARILVVSVGLSEINFMYCALATDVNPAKATTENRVVRSRLSMV
jgi:hypothetical protein